MKLLICVVVLILSVVVSAFPALEDQQQAYEAMPLEDFEEYVDVVPMESSDRDKRQVIVEVGRPRGFGGGFGRGHGWGGGYGGGFGRPYGYGPGYGYGGYGGYGYGGYGRF